MENLEADVVVVGSGMGGGTTGWALAQRGVDVLLLERGERLPREAENWSPDEVFIRRRYKPAELWEDGAGVVILATRWEQVPAARKLIAAPGPFNQENLKGRLPA